MIITNNPMNILKPEVEEGNIEYKRVLTAIDNSRLEQLATQMKWRLAEGDNEAIYYLGVNDNGSLYQMTQDEKIETFKNFKLLVNKVQAKIINFNEIETNNITYFKFHIRIKNPILPEVRILLMGDTETGKTTFLANLLLDKTFNEKSDSRIYMMNHKHELETKKTSSVNCNYIIYANTKYAFIEAPGHIKYAKTKYKLLLSTQPNIVIEFVNSKGVPNQFNMFICEHLKIPVLKANIFDTNCIFNCAKPINKVNLFNQIALVKTQYNLNKSTSSYIKINILNVYPHNDLGIVVSGFLVSGEINISQQLFWSYRDSVTQCKVKSIHINSEPVDKINTNQMFTLCLKCSPNIKKNWKNGIISNQKEKQIVQQINFKFVKFPGSGSLSTSVYGFSANRVAHIYNIVPSGEHFTGTINSYILNNNIIVVDFGLTKGIIIPLFI